MRTLAAIPGFPAYKVGDDGTVWTCRQRKSLGYGRGTAWPMTNTWTQMKSYIGHGGYPRVSLRENGVAHRIAVPILVLLAFRGPAPQGQECRHRDGNAGNSCLANLCWDTHKNNMADTKLHGTNRWGESCPRAKLTESQAREILSLKGKVDSGSLSKKFGIKRHTITALWRRETWKQL